MPYLTLTLSGHEVDLPPDAQVALSYRVNDLTTLDSREAAFSEVFTLPLTARNAAALGVPHALDSQTDAPYMLLPAVLTTAGGTELLRGFAILEQAGEGYEVTLTDAVGGLFAQIGERELRELDLSAHDHLLTLDAVQAAQSEAGAYTYPLADDGRLTGRYPDAGHAVVHHTELPLAVFSRTLLAAVVAEALPGYRVGGSLLSDATFLRHQLVGPGPQRRTAYLEQHTLVATASVARTYASILSTGESTDLSFDAVSQDPGAHYGTLQPEGTEYRLPAHVADFRVQVELEVTYQGTGGPYSGTQRIALVVSENGLGFAEEVIYEGNWSEGTVPQTRQLRIDTTFRRVGANGAIRVQIVPQNRMQATIAAGARLTVTPLPRAYDNSPVHVDAGLPEISQADFVQLVANSFGAIVQLDATSRLVRFDLLNDLERNRSRAVDWTDRLDYSRRPTLRYRLDGLAQRNTFAYADAPSGYNELAPLPDTEAPALLVSGDATLPRETEAYAAPLALLRSGRSLQRAALLPFLAQFAQGESVLFALWRDNIAYTTDAFVLDQGRYWQAQKIIDSTYARPGTNPEFWRLADESEVFKSGGSADGFVALYAPQSAIPGVLVGSSGDDAGFAPTAGLSADELDFARLLPRYYAGLQRILSRTRLLTLALRLTPVDLAALDFSRPVRLATQHLPGYGQLAGLFYLNTIDQYIPGAPGAVDVTLLAMGDSVPGLAPVVTVPIQTPTKRALLLETLEPLRLEGGELLLLED